MKQLRKFYDEIIINRTPPKNIKKGDELLFGGTPFQWVIEESGLFEIKNCIVSSEGIVLKNYFPLKKFIVCFRQDFKNYYLKYILKIIFKTKKINLPKEENYILIFDNYSGPNGFAHWLSDGLTRLVEVTKELKNCTVLAPEYFKHNKIYLETLSFFEIKNIYFIQKNTSVFLNKLIVPSHIAESGNYYSKNIKKIQSHFDSINNAHKNQLFERIYISRAKAQRRFVTNEEEVVKFLSIHNFKVLYFEDFSFKEQVAFMKNAKIVVSIHGAALSLAMFMSQGTSLLEFKINNDNKNCMFFSLCDAANINYYYIFCNGAVNTDRANNFDIVVDLKELNKVIPMIISSN